MKEEINMELVNSIANDFDWFDHVDFSDANIISLSKTELIMLLKKLNNKMIKSLDNWEGG